MKKEPGILVSSPDLRPSLTGILKGLAAAGILKRVVTTLAFDAARPLDRLALRAGGGRRAVPGYLAGKVRRIWVREAIRLAASRFGTLAAHRVYRWAEAGFDEAVASRYAGRYECIYGMESACLATFTRQKKENGSCILRQVMAHAGEAAVVLREETARHPGLVNDYLRTALSEESAAVARKEREYAMADLIVANSDFVRATFLRRGVPEEKVRAVPTGFPPAKVRAKRAPGKPLVFLCVGTVSLRKGIPYLLHAWRKLEAGTNAELRIAGPLEIPGEALNASGIRYLGAVPRDVLKSHYEEADVFVLPTLLEGRAHAVLEAMSHGLPVLTTLESGCGDCVHTGVNGIIVPARDGAALTAAMGECLQHTGRLEEWGAASAARAASWTVQDADAAHLAVILDFLKTNGKVFYG